MQAADAENVLQTSLFSMDTNSEKLGQWFLMLKSICWMQAADAEKNLQTSLISMDTNSGKLGHWSLMPKSICWVQAADEEKFPCELIFMYMEISHS